MINTIRNILFCLAVLLGCIGCNKTEVEEAREVTTQFSFVVKDLRLSADSPGYVLQAGDKIEMTVKGYDWEAYQQMYKMMIPASPEFYVKCSLVHNGSDWDLIRDGQVIQEIEIKGDEDTFVSIEGLFFNPQNGAPRVAREEKHLKEWQGRQVIDLVFH